MNVNNVGSGAAYSKMILNRGISLLNYFVFIMAEAI